MTNGRPEIDVAQFPEDIAALIDGLGPGEELIITRAGVPVAAISRAGAIEGDIVLPSKPQQEPERPAAGYDNVTVVATAMKLPESARESLSAELGADCIVVDMHSAPATTDVLLIPPASPQLIGHLRAMFPKARIVVTEIEDDSLGVSYRGPIGRMLDAGAEIYLQSTTIPSVAAQLTRALTQLPQIAGGSAASPEIEPPSTPPGNRLSRRW